MAGSKDNMEWIGAATARILQASTASTSAVALYLSCVRRLLKKTKGYECQEADSTFMLAFEAPADAAQFCLLVSTPWPSDRHVLVLGLICMLAS